MNDIKWIGTQRYEYPSHDIIFDDVLSNLSRIIDGKNLNKNGIFGITYRDRFSNLNYCNRVSFSKISDKICFSEKSFEEICFERAKFFLSFRKEIAILWSGGLDSTAVVCSFIGSGEDISNVIVIGTKSSLIENKIFYEKTKNKILYKIVEDENLINELSKNEERIFLTGDGMVLTIPHVLDNFYFENYKKKWKDGIKNILFYHNIFNVEDTIFGIEKIEKFLKVSDKEMSTSQILHLISFSLYPSYWEYQIPYHILLSEKFKNPSNVVRNFKMFFGDPFFDGYVVKNFNYLSYLDQGTENKIKTNFKEPLKKFINSVIFCDNIKNFGKIPSWNFKKFTNLKSKNDISNDLIIFRENFCFDRYKLNGIKRNQIPFIIENIISNNK